MELSKIMLVLAIHFFLFLTIETYIKWVSQVGVEYSVSVNRFIQLVDFGATVSNSDKGFCTTTRFFLKCLTTLMFHRQNEWTDECFYNWNLQFFLQFTTNRILKWHHIPSTLRFSYPSFQPFSLFSWFAIFFF